MQFFLAKYNSQRKSTRDNSLFAMVRIIIIIILIIIGLPLDTTDQEFIEMMSKYGIIMQDPDTGLVPFIFFTVLNKIAVSCHVNDASQSEIQVKIKSTIASLNSQILLGLSQH